MQLVMSQAWTLDAGAAADGYIAASGAMDAFLTAQPGFVRRELVRGLEDRTHFVNLRWWDDVEAYLTMTRLPEYPSLIEGLSQWLDLARYREHGYPREFLDVVIHDAAGRAAS